MSSYYITYDGICELVRDWKEQAAVIERKQPAFRTSSEALALRILKNSIKRGEAQKLVHPDRPRQLPLNEDLVCVVFVDTDGNVIKS